MVRTRRQTAAIHGVLIASAFEHPTLIELVGNRKYLQMDISKAIARAYALKFGAVTSKFLSRSFAKNGDLSLLVWAREAGCDWSESLFLNAIEGVQVAVMEWLFENECPLPSVTQAFASAVKAHNLKMLDWLRQNNFELNADICAAAAHSGWLEGLEWLRAHGCSWDSKVRELSAMAGHLHVLKFAHHNGCPGSLDSGSHFAAVTGQLEVLKWMFEAGAAGWWFDSRPCEGAAYGGHLAVLQFLRANNVAWGAWTTMHARQQGHLDVVRWLLDNGCPDWTPVDDGGYWDTDYMKTTEW